VVEAVRHAVDGGGAAAVVTGVLALSAYAIGSVLLIVAVARRSRRLTPSALHPELAI
jgi:putative membrane protein